MLKNFFWDGKLPADEREALVLADAQARSIRVSGLAIATMIFCIARLSGTTMVPMWTIVLACVIYAFVGLVAGYTVIRKADLELKRRPITMSRETWSWISTMVLLGCIQPYQQTLFFVGSGLLACILIMLLLKTKKISPESFSDHALLSAVLFVFYVVFGWFVISPSLL